jgi:hypothetical protein
MSSVVNHQVIFERRPEGLPTEEVFTVAQVPVPGEAMHAYCVGEVVASNWRRSLAAVSWASSARMRRRRK